MSDGVEESDLRLVLTSPAFWVGTCLLVLWGLAIVYVFKVHGPCDDSICELALV